MFTALLFTWVILLTYPWRQLNQQCSTCSTSQDLETVISPAIRFRALEVQVRRILSDFTLSLWSPEFLRVYASGVSEIPHRFAFWKFDYCTRDVAHAAGFAEARRCLWFLVAVHVVVVVVVFFAASDSSQTLIIAVAVVVPIVVILFVVCVVVACKRRFDTNY